MWMQDEEAFLVPGPVVDLRRASQTTAVVCSLCPDAEQARVVVRLGCGAMSDVRMADGQTVPGLGIIVPSGWQPGTIAVTVCASQEVDRLTVIHRSGSLFSWRWSDATFVKAVVEPMECACATSIQSGKLLVVGCSSAEHAKGRPTLEVLDALSLRRVNSVQPSSAAATCFRATPSGHMLAVGMDDGMVMVLDPATQELRVLRTFAGHAAAVIAIDFSADGDWIRACDAAGRVLMWRTSSGEPLVAMDFASALPWSSAACQPAVARAPWMTDDDITAIAGSCADGSVFVATRSAGGTGLYTVPLYRSALGSTVRKSPGPSHAASVLQRLQDHNALLAVAGASVWCWEVEDVGGSASGSERAPRAEEDTSTLPGARVRSSSVAGPAGAAAPPHWADALAPTRMPPVSANPPAVGVHVEAAASCMPSLPLVPLGHASVAFASTLGLAVVHNTTTKLQQCLQVRASAACCLIVRYMRCTH